MVVLEIEEIEDQGSQEGNYMWSELTTDINTKEENRNGKGRIPEIYDPYTWDNGNQPARQPMQAYSQAYSQTKQSQVQHPNPIQRQPMKSPPASIHDEMLLKYNVQIVNGKMRYVDPTKGITVPTPTKPVTKPTQSPINQLKKSANDQCTTKQCPFKKQAKPSQNAPPRPTHKTGNMFGPRRPMVPARSKKLVM